MVSVVIFGGLTMFIVAYHGLQDTRTHRWRKIENRSDAFAYLTLHTCIILGAISMIFVEPRVIKLLGY